MSTCEANDIAHELSDAAVWKVIPDLDKLLEKDRNIGKAGVQCPDFFICGAAKSGTTSLFQYLGQHPDVFTPTQKEPGYFSQLRPLRNTKEYLDIFGEASENQLVGEASTAYLTSPDSAYRIAEAIPDAKIIIMLRNPADRAYSLYRWMTKEGYDYARSFKEALRLEENKRYENPNFCENNPEYYYNYLYFHSGLYQKQVKKYLERFSREKIKFVIFEEFVSDTFREVEEVYEFLELKKGFKPETEVHNKGKTVRFPYLQYCIKNFLGRAAKKFFEKEGERWVNYLLNANIENKSESLSSSLRYRLLKFYEQDIKYLSSLVGKDFENVWLKSNL
jgi:hypothetical protein